MQFIAVAEDCVVDVVSGRLSAVLRAQLAVGNQNLILSPESRKFLKFSTFDSHFG